MPMHIMAWLTRQAGLSLTNWVKREQARLEEEAQQEDRTASPPSWEVVSTTTARAAAARHLAPTDLNPSLDPY